MAAHSWMLVASSAAIRPARWPMPGEACQQAERDRPAPRERGALMKRLGHSSMAAARRYLHAVDGRYQEIAKALSVLASHGDVARLPKSVTA